MGVRIVFWTVTASRCRLRGRCHCWGGCKEPRLLILDEATSGLDQRTEASLYESLSRLGCAFVTITHRLETIRDFDEIVVLDEGIVVENGSFESLLEGGGLFSKMYFAYQESTKDGL